MNLNPLIELIEQNFSDLDSLHQLQSVIECMIEKREYQIKSSCAKKFPLDALLNVLVPKSLVHTLFERASSARQINLKKD